MSSERWAADRDSGAGPRGRGGTCRRAAYERTAPRLLFNALLPKRARGALASNGGVARMHVPCQLRNQWTSVGGARLCDPQHAKFRGPYSCIPQYLELRRYPLRCTAPTQDYMHWLQNISPPFAGTPHSNFTGADWDSCSHPASISRLLPTAAPVTAIQTHCNGRRRGRALPSWCVLGPLAHCPVPHVRRKLEITGDTPRTPSPAGQ